MPVFYKAADPPPSAVSAQKLLTRWHQPSLPPTARATAGALGQSTSPPSGSLVRASGRAKASLWEG